VLSEGQAFGERALLAKNVSQEYRTASVVVNGGSKVYCVVLLREDFLKVYNGLNL
jgi:hypothetical protein